MPRVYLALSRHGAYQQPARVPSAHLPYPLTEEGERQTHQLVDDVLAFVRTRDCAIDPVVEASPLLRAWQTALLAARRLSTDHGFELRVAEHNALTERSLGNMANLTVEAIEDIFACDPRFDPPPADWKTRSDYRLPVPGAESLLQAGERVARHLTETARTLSAQAKRDSVKVIVGHGGSIRHAAALLGVLDLPAVRGLSMHHCRPVFLEWSPTRGFQHAAGEWKVRSSHDRLD